MTRLADYLNIRNNIIRPALEELKNEYEAQGYQYSIGSQAPGSWRREAIDSPPQIRSAMGPISFSKERPNGITRTIPIFYWDGDSVIFNGLEAAYTERVLLDDINPNRVKEEVKKYLK